MFLKKTSVQEHYKFVEADTWAQTGLLGTCVKIMHRAAITTTCK